MFAFWPPAACTLSLSLNYSLTSTQGIGHSGQGVFVQGNTASRLVRGPEPAPWRCEQGAPDLRNVPFLFHLEMEPLPSAEPASHEASLLMFQCLRGPHCGGTGVEEAEQGVMYGAASSPERFSGTHSRAGKPEALG